MSGHYSILEEGRKDGYEKGSVYDSRLHVCVMS